eukprot:1818072-Pyramimonas_sp.AAC.1
MKLWAVSCLRRLPVRVNPIVMGDINDGMGISKIAGEWVEVETGSLGRVRSKEYHRGGAGEMFRELMSEFGLFSPTT